MPASQAQSRWVYAHQDDPGKTGAFAREVVGELHDRGPGSVKALPKRIKDGKPIGKKPRPFGALSP